MTSRARSGAQHHGRIARSLAPSLRDLGSAMASASAPDSDFRHNLRRRLLEEAARTSRPGAGPDRTGRRGGLRYTALGIGMGLAGSGIAALTLQLIANASSVIAQGGWPPLR
jgi:hypothetical protein